MSTQYETIIGLEIHIRLNTESKMFCGTHNRESEEPNIDTCPICMGHPGTLPALNAEAVRKGTLLALALGADVPEYMKFDRKNYFYPDLPKAYQISQFDQPLAWGGTVNIELQSGEIVPVGIERLHLEEDTAKLKHGRDGVTLADFNRAGAPLLELVSKPDMRTPEEAKGFVMTLQQLCRYLDVSYADLEKAHMRCDVNISLRPVGDDALYPKTEIKNINSFRSIERAVQYETERLTALWNNHEAPEVVTTRGWDDSTGTTVLQRLKEDAADYRFFPEPDIPPVRRTRAEIDAIGADMPELPQQKRNRFREEYSLSYNDALFLTGDPRLAQYFEESLSELREWMSSIDTEGTDEERWEKNGKKLARLTSNWLSSEVVKLLNATGTSIAELKMTPENFAELLVLVFEKRVNSTAAQKILSIMFENGGDPTEIMQNHDLEQVSDSTMIEAVVDTILMNNAEVVADVRGGKEKALMYLVGQVMKETKGKINPAMATALLKEKMKQE